MVHTAVRAHLEHTSRAFTFFVVVLALVTACSQPADVGAGGGTDGPNGLRDGAPPPSVRAFGGAQTDTDLIAMSALSDLNEFWTGEFRSVSPRPFTPLTLFLSWDAAAAVPDSGVFCEITTSGLENAAYCPIDNSIGWDRGVLLPYVEQHFGQLGVATIMAHEFGHAISAQAGFLDNNRELRGYPLLVWEQQADCYAGVYLRHVTDGNSRWFTLNTGEGLSTVLAAMVAIRDHDLTAPETGHGSGFDRVTALQLGFTEGSERCALIGEDELEQRRTIVPHEFAGPHDTGELPITEGTVRLVADSFLELFPAEAPPALIFERDTPGCSHGTYPVNYCPDHRGLEIDLDGLSERGQPVLSPGPFPTAIRGDFTAFSIVASRLAIASLHDRGLPIQGPNAALAAACMTGAWAGQAAHASIGRIYLSPGDLDEALGELLAHGLIASDVEGAATASGFDRVEAFRSGIMHGADSCSSQ
ncbi:neutral zinc metallopeptidase [Hoyosella altamirensis]